MNPPINLNKDEQKNKVFMHKSQQTSQQGTRNVKTHSMSKMSNTDLTKKTRVNQGVREICFEHQERLLRAIPSNSNST